MKKQLLILILLAAFPLSGCDGFLDEKPNKDIVTPGSLSDLNAMLDNDQTMNIVPGLFQIGTDDLFTTDQGWMTYSTGNERNAYIWKKELLETPTFADWGNPYRTVFYSNLILDILESIEKTEENASLHDRIQGSAMFYRANAFFSLARTFARSYLLGDPSESPGVPMPLSTNVNDRFPRAGLRENYERILSDLNSSLPLLPEKVEIKTRPSLWAAQALLARVYLDMGRFEDALRHAALALEIDGKLMDYSEMDPALAVPFPKYNREVIFHAQPPRFSFITRALTLVDSALYNSYGEGDLRKTLFFRESGIDGFVNFRGNYTGTPDLMSGLTVDELYLIKAECEARLMQTENALTTLNLLLETRWEKESFEPLSALDSRECLLLVLEERRKELLFRGHRWADLKRLNTEADLAKTLIRRLEGEEFILEPNSPEYVLPVPQQELDHNPIEQNPR